MWNVIYFTIISLSLVNCEYKYETKWFEVPLDHFGYHRNETFKIKYLENKDSWDPVNGPIFFYTGNEGQIEVFAKHSGFIWEIAPEFKARVIFAEHRYYGASMPFGNKSLDREHIGFLSSSQALADYADLISFLQGDDEDPRYPVITFGGSYGGMLSAYFRMKYPHIVTGAIAASAPIHMFPGMVPCESFNTIVASSFAIASNNCMRHINSSWTVIRKEGSKVNNTLKKDWNLCDPVKNSTDVDKLVDFLSSMYVTLAMVNYPFATDFLMSLPPYPVKYVCQYLNASTLDDEKLLQGIGKILQVYTNYDNKKDQCVNYLKGDDYGNLDASGWDFQACTEMVMPICSRGNKVMFEPAAWNFTQYSKDCHDKYGVYPREHSAMIEYGGRRLYAASNIVFSNGLLDPWAVGGIQEHVSKSVISVIIPDAAHHLDLMASNPQDPDTVGIARDIHKENIRKWISAFRSQN